MADPAALRGEYESLKERASETLRQGNLQGALELFDRAHALSRDLGEPSLEDMAYCNRSAVAIRLQRGDQCEPTLRQMLLRTSDSLVAYLSSYHLAQACDARKDYKKALFYARIAHRYAAALEDGEYQASALNEIGNARMALNDFHGALGEYSEAAGLLGPGETERRAFVLANLGYCLLLLGRLEQGFDAVIRGLRVARRVRAPRAESLGRLCLSFGHLLIGRPWYAARHGGEALELAEEQGDERTMKYALLLLGESYKQGGKTLVARECFDVLQQTYYPGMPQVPEMLLEVDVCRVINLRA
jgi:tetratricopeptide (TPR) repeat protein